MFDLVEFVLMIESEFVYCLFVVLDDCLIYFAVVWFRLDC